MPMEPGSPSPKRPQLSVDELHQLRWLLGSVLTLLSAWSMFYLSLEAWMLMGIITLASLAGIVWPRLPSRVPAYPRVRVIAHASRMPAARPPPQITGDCELLET